LEKKKKSQEAKSREYGGRGTTVMFLGGQKLLPSQRGVHGRVVLMEYTVVRTPFVWPLPSPVLRTSERKSALRGLTWKIVWTDTIQSNKNFCKTVT
jgi:hypothetical protein